MTKLQLQPNFIRHWRLHMDMSLEALADAVAMDKGNLSKIERALAPWNQAILENLSQALHCTPADLLTVNPAKPSIFPIWQHASDDQKEQLVKLADVLVGYTPPGSEPR